MRKIGPLMAIISGLALTILATLSLLAQTSVLHDMSWLNGFKSNAASGFNGSVSAKTMFGILIGVGLFEVLLGMFAWANGHGFSAFILLGLFVTAIVFAVIGGMNAHSFPTATIIMITIESIAAFGMLAGFFGRD